MDGLTLKPPDVIGLHAAAEELGVSHARIYQLAARADFPPGQNLRAGKVYSRAHIRAFKLERELQQPVMLALAAYEDDGTIAAAARAGGVDPATIRRWWRRISVALPAER